MASETVEAHRELSPSRAWWLRIPAVLLSPRSVFFALREDDEDDEADWIVDLGPEGGDEGGEVIATRTPEDVAEVEESATRQFLRSVLAERAAAAA